MHLTRNQAYLHGYRGFKSLSLRHTFISNGKPNFDLSIPCPSCGYKIQPSELLRVTSHIIKCPKCGGEFDEVRGRKLLSTS